MTIGFYQVQSGDQLYQILRSHYGSAGFLRDRAAVTRLVVENNPQISDIDRIYPNQIIVLPPLAGGGISSPILPKTVPPALPPQALQSCHTAERMT